MAFYSFRSVRIRTLKKYLLYIFVGLCIHGLCSLLGRRDHRLSLRVDYSESRFATSQAFVDLAHSSIPAATDAIEPNTTDKRLLQSARIEGELIRLSGFSFCHMLNNAYFRTDVIIRMFLH